MCDNRIKQVILFKKFNIDQNLLCSLEDYHIRNTETLGEAGKARGKANGDKIRMWRNMLSLDKNTKL